MIYRTKIHITRITAAAAAAAEDAIHFRIRRQRGSLLQQRRRHEDRSLAHRPARRTPSDCQLQSRWQRPAAIEIEFYTQICTDSD